MRLLHVGLFAAAALATASPALASVTVNPDVSGTPDSYQVFGIKDTGQVVYGSSPNNTNIPNVKFIAGTAQDVSVDIKNGFAQLNDANTCHTCTPDWTQIIINPDLLFTDMKFAISLTGGSGLVNVYYLLDGDPTSAADDPLNYSFWGTISGDGSNKNFELSGGTFNGLMLAIAPNQPGLTLGTLKQISYEPLNSAVPEPATWAFMLLGFGGVGAALRRGHKQRGKNGRLLQIA